MQGLACAGSAAEFFAFFDRDAFTENSVVQAENVARRMLAEHDTPLQRQGFQEYLKTEPQKIRAMVADTFSEWGTDMKQGKDSDFCRMTVLDATELQNDADVHVRTPSGKDKVWRLGRRGKEWRLVDMFGANGNVPPLGSAVTATLGPPPVDRASVDAVLSSVAHAMRLLKASGHSSSGDVLAGRYEMALGDLRNAGQQLFPRAPAGVPDDVARDVSSKLQELVSAFEAEMRCVSRSGGRTHVCDEISAENYQSSVELGKSIVGLAAYGTKPISEALDSIKGPESTADQRQ